MAAVTAAARSGVPAGFAIRPLSAVLGAEIVGLDLAQPLDAALRRTVYDAFVRYHVLAFRDQRLTPEQQIAFSQQFGTLERHIARNRGLANPWVHVVSNLDAEGKPSGKLGSTRWHTDKSFRPEPSLATILHAVTMPPDGGDTCFANMYAAYDALDPAEQAALDGLRVVHSWELSRQKIGERATPEEIRDAPPISHPLVRVHPDTGRKCLFMGEHASHVEGGAIETGRARLAALEAHATRERFVYRHRWRAGDLLMWDNRCLLHRADANFDAARHARVLHRTCLRGTAPA
ncbi:MAG TPA: TauD/TfdA family dioxygenase [Candidatus Sulfotelmatobacter sp.]|nr:TauD/TfdA family dioxygenase [Candidatus Sulfotelmatobacter sp.]